MRHWKELTDGEIEAKAIRYARGEAYERFVPVTMNRKERRTALGKMRIAQAEAAAMKAELDYLRARLGITEKGPTP